MAGLALLPGKALAVGVELALAHALEALIDEDAVVAVEADDVGDRAERHEIEQGGEIGFGDGLAEPARSRNSARNASIT